jgi:hypothetical protein
MPTPEKKSLYEEIATGVADAIVDIREKVVEEGWFGRVVTNREAVTELNWGWPERHDAQPEQGEHNQDHERDVAEDGIDR